MSKYYQGNFKPRNPSKYIGDTSNIVYRSRWEFILMSYLDSHPDVVEWGSEELVIPYVSPIDGKVHRYFTDFIVRQVDKDGNEKTIVIEVKPEKQTRPPEISKSKKKTAKYINEVKTWGVNSAKWEAAEKYCKSKGWVFQIMNEKHLGIK